MNDTPICCKCQKPVMTGGAWRKDSGWYCESCWGSRGDTSDPDRLHQALRSAFPDIAYTERTYRLHQRSPRPSKFEFQWKYDDDGSPVSDIFATEAEALAWANGRITNVTFA